MPSLERTATGAWLLTPAEVRAEGLVLHGYGGCKEEMLGLAAVLATRLGVRLAVPDLPGHGESTDELLTRTTAEEAARKALSLLHRPSFFVGHSMGARVGLALGLPVAAGLSVPGEASFEGSPREMLRVLRARRVREASPYEGLREVLETPLRPAPTTLLVQAENDIASVARLAEEWAAGGVPVRRALGCDHLDIVAAPSAADHVVAFLTDVLA